MTKSQEDENIVLCKCGHDVEDHNDIWKLSTECGQCSCEEWDAFYVKNTNN